MKKQVTLRASAAHESVKAIIKKGARLILSAVIVWNHKHCSIHTCEDVSHKSERFNPLSNPPHRLSAGVVHKDWVSWAADDARTVMATVWIHRPILKKKKKVKPWQDLDLKPWSFDFKAYTTWYSLMVFFSGTDWAWPRSDETGCFSGWFGHNSKTAFISVRICIEINISVCPPQESSPYPGRADTWSQVSWQPGRVSV